MKHFSRHPATFWEELSGLCIWPSGLLSSCKEGVVKSPKQHRAWANSVPAYFCLTHEIPTKPLTPWCVCVCVGGGGGTPFNLGWGCAAECVGTWPSSIIKGHKPCSRQNCEDRCPVPTCSGTRAGTATLFFAARFWREKSNPDPGRVPKPEWAKSTTCSWQKRWFLDPIPDSEAKTIPCWAAHPRIAHIYGSTPPPPPGALPLQDKICNVIATPIKWVFPDPR